MPMGRTRPCHGPRAGPRIASKVGGCMARAGQAKAVVRPAGSQEQQAIERRAIEWARSGSTAPPPAWHTSSPGRRRASGSGGHLRRRPAALHATWICPGLCRTDLAAGAPLALIVYLRTFFRVHAPAPLRCLRQRWRVREPPLWPITPWTIPPPRAAWASAPSRECLATGCRFSPSFLPQRALLPLPTSGIPPWCARRASWPPWR